MILIVGTKLQMIITKLGLLIQEKGEIVKGMPLVQPGDHLFWFGRPRFILFLVHLVLFTVLYTYLHDLFSFLLTTTKLNMFNNLQNAFQLAFFAWSTVSNQMQFHILHYQFPKQPSLDITFCYFCSMSLGLRTVSTKVL